MAELPPLAQVQQRQLVPYNNAGQVPIAGVNGGGELATLAQAVGQGATSIAQGFEPSTMAMRYQNAMNYAPMSNTERLLTIMPAADIIGGGFLAGAKVPRNALASNAVRREGAETLPEVEEIIAYHGSPHNFDKFQMDKIGTGEGAQAYGHGLYYTDLEDIAIEYKDKLTKTSFETIDGQPFDPYELLSDGTQTIKNPNVRANLNKNEGDIDKAIEKAKQVIETFEMPSSQPLKVLAKEDLVLLEKIKANGGLKKNKGKTYKVSIQSKLDDMLDYDELLSDQPKILSKIEDAYGDSEIIIKQLGLDPETATGGSLVQALAGVVRDADSQKAASDWLLKAKINGTKYLDNFSRNAPYEIKLSTKKGPYDTEKISASSKRQAEQLADDYKEKGFKTEIVKSGTSNYVIFNEDLVKILAKYGIVGGVGLAAANEFSSPAQADSYPNYMPPQAPELDANPVQPRPMRPNEA